MSYPADKPYGRRKTDQNLPEEKRRYLQSIRRDVDEDPSGMIRRYLRLASKALDEGTAARDRESSQNQRRIDNPRRQAA
jgi:hypothetical protein